MDLHRGRSEEIHRRKDLRRARRDLHRCGPDQTRARKDQNHFGRDRTRARRDPRVRDRRGAPYLVGFSSLNFAISRRSTYRSVSPRYLDVSPCRQACCSSAATTSSLVSPLLKLNPHLHAVFLDGVFVQGEGDALGWHALPRLCTSEVADVLHVARVRIVRHLLRRAPRRARGRRGRRRAGRPRRARARHGAACRRRRERVAAGRPGAATAANTMSRSPPRPPPITDAAPSRRGTPSTAAALRGP